MIHNLKNCVEGTAALYKTTLQISERDGRLHFRFVADTSERFCPYSEYNDAHYLGDVCEVFIGSHPEKKEYYEFEITPGNKQFLAHIKYCGEDESGKPILHTTYVEESFVDSTVTPTENGYVAEFSFNKERVKTGDGELCFNAYRIETDGGEAEKHLFSLVPTLKRKFHVPSCFVPIADYLD